MSFIYDHNGNQLAVVFNKDGTALNQAFDAYGNPLMETETYSIENVVYHYRQPTLNVANEVNQLSNDWQSFIFITDTHGSGNMQHSQAIGLYLLANTSVKMIVLGGDYSLIAWDKTQYANYMSPFLESEMMDNIYAVMGNHEMQSGATSYSESSQCIYEDFLADKTNITGVLNQNYYYFDDIDNKIRYMFINTSEGAIYRVSESQLNWIRQNVQLPDTNWNLVVIGHVNLVQFAGVTVDNEANGSDIVSAIEETNGTLVGYFCGHQHIDYVAKESGMYHATFLCDKLENSTHYEGISVTGRSAGTTTEQAVTVISINTTTKDVVCRRVGAGRNSQFSFNYVM